LPDLKRAAAILFMTIFLFNWCGYRILTVYLQQQANVQLEAQLDRNDYDESQLIEMRVSLNMPYQASSTDFERYDGEIEIKGIHYKYVKRRIDNGQLVLLCLPNQTKMQLQQARDDFFQLVNDLSTSSQTKNTEHGHTFKNPVTEYWQQQQEWCMEALTGQPVRFTARMITLPVHPVIVTRGQPPQC
jgi:hypothetical protein